MSTHSVRFQDINTLDGVAFMAMITGRDEKYKALIEATAKMRSVDFAEVDAQVRGHLNTLRDMARPIFVQSQTVKIMVGDGKPSEEQNAQLKRSLETYHHDFLKYCADELALDMQESEVVLDALLKLASRQ